MNKEIESKVQNDMLSISYDTERCDVEWYEAQNANEKEIYYKDYTKLGICHPLIRKYKPSVAKVLAKRAGLRLIPIIQNIQYTRYEKLIYGYSYIFTSNETEVKDIKNCDLI